MSEQEKKSSPQVSTPLAFSVKTIERLSEQVNVPDFRGGSAVTDHCSGEQTNGTSQSCCCS